MQGMKLESLESLHWEQFESLLHGNSLFMMLNIITFFGFATFKKEKYIKMTYAFNFCHIFPYLLPLDDLTILNFEYNIDI